MVAPPAAPLHITATTPPITTYAGAARALGSNATPAATRLAVTRALVAAAPRLSPSPLPLVAAHVAYVLGHAEEAGAEAEVRGEYWRLMGEVGGGRRVEGDRAWGPAAVMALRGGDVGEVEAVMGMVERDGEWVGGGLEGRAELVAAVVAVDGGERGRGVVRGFREALERCGNGKRAAGVVLRFVLPCLVRGGGEAWGLGLRAEVAEVAVRGLFAVPAAALEGGGYYKELFAWVRGLGGNDALPAVVEWMMEGFLGRVGEELKGGDGGRDGRKRKRAEAGDGVWGVLPQEILVPLVFFKDLVVTLRGMVGEGVGEPAVAALARLFGVAAKAGVYRPSYDLRPTVKVLRRGDGEREKVGGGTNDVRVLKREKDGAPCVGLPDPREGINVGREIAGVVRAVTAMLEAGSGDGDSAKRLTVAISSTLVTSLLLSLDAVAAEVPGVLSELAKRATGASDTAIESIANVVASLLSAYASTRQLPEVAAAIGRNSAGLVRVLSSKSVLDVLSSAIVLAPRGHALLFVQALFAEYGSSAGSDRRELLTLATVVLEAAPPIEHGGLATVFADVVRPVMSRREKSVDQLDSEELLLLRMRTSVLFVMANAGIPLASPVFAKCLFSDAAGDGGDSSPDSDSSDYESFMEQRRRRESPRARFTEALATGTAWKRSPARQSKMIRRRPRCGDAAAGEGVQGPIPVDVLVLHLRYLASLAHVCVSDSALCKSQPVSSDAASGKGSGSNGTAPAPPSPVPRSHAAPAVDVALREVWTVFQAIDMSRVADDFQVSKFVQSPYARMVLAGGSVIGLLKASRLHLDAKNFCSGASDGFKTFVALALLGGRSLDPLFDELWECRAVRSVFAEVVADKIMSLPRIVVQAALGRCAYMPVRYLPDDEEQLLGACCLRVAAYTPPDEASLAALCVLGSRRFLPAKLGDLEALSKAAALAIEESSGDLFIASLVRKGDWMDSCSGADGRSTILSLLSKQSSSVGAMKGFLRGALRAFEEQLDSTTIEAANLAKPLNRIIVKMEGKVGKLLSAKVDGVAGELDQSVFSAVEALAQVLVCVRNVNDRRVGAPCASRGNCEPRAGVEPVSTSGIDHEQAKLVLKRVMGLLLSSCCTGGSSPAASLTSALVTFLRGGDRSPCVIAFGRDQGLAIKLRLGAVCIKWLHVDESGTSYFAEESKDTGPCAVLVTLLNSGGASRSAVASAVCDGIRLELDRGCIGLAGAARVVLGCGGGDQRLALSCLESAVGAMRVWGWLDKPGDAVARVVDTALRMDSDDMYSNRDALVHEAVCGAESWARAQAGRSVRSTTEHMLQLLSRVLSSRRVPSRTLRPALRTVAIVLKQASSSGGAAGPSTSTPSGVLWAAERTIRSVLLHPGRLCEPTAVALARALESVAATGSGATPHAIALTAASASALVGVNSAAVRRAMVPGVGSLLAAGDAPDAVVRGTMAILRGDAERDVLRALRSEIIEGGGVYRGRA